MGEKNKGRLVGYARVSTAEQSLDMQIEVLSKAGVHSDHLHIEKVSAARSKRPKLEWALKTLRPGDTFVVWRLDRMGRNLADLQSKMDIITGEGARFLSLTENIDTTTPLGKLYFQLAGAFAEFERNVIVERTRSGVREAMAKGTKFGVDRKLSDKQLAQAQKWRDAGVPVRTIANRLSVSHATIYDWTAGASRPRKR